MWFCHTTQSSPIVSHPLPPQELTARTHFKGNVRKRLLPLYLGAAIATEGQPAPTPSAPELVVPGLPFAPHACLVGEGRGSKVAVGDSLVMDGPGDDGEGGGGGGKKAKSIGKVVAVASEGGVPVAVGMVRLEAVLPSHRRIMVVPQDGGGEVAALPFTPPWWPTDLDPATGKRPAEA